MQSIVFGTKRKLCKCNTLNIVCNGNVNRHLFRHNMISLTLSGDIIASDVLSKTSNKLKGNRNKASPKIFVFYEYSLQQQ